MICPVMSKIESPIFNSQGVRILETGFSSVECRERNCAWWDLEHKACSIPRISKELDWIGNVLERNIASGS